MVCRHNILALGLFLLSGPALAASELSLLSGLYRNASYKSGDTNSGSMSDLGLGLRFAQPIQGRLYWFTQGNLDLRGYSKGSAAGAPSNSVNLEAGGGIRYYFDKLSDRVEPYVLAGGLFRTDKVATQNGQGYTEVDKNGLYYHADFGIRFSLQKEFFVDFEVPLFESALFATEKTINAVYSGNGTTTTSNEKQRFELFAQSTSPFNGMNVALGLRF